MNSISNGCDSTKWAEMPYFFVVPQVRTKMSKKSKQEKKHEDD